MVIFDCPPSLPVTDARGEYDLVDYLGAKLRGTAVALLVVAGLLVAIRFPTDTAAVILLIAVSKALDALSDVFLSFWQQREHMRLVSRHRDDRSPLQREALACDTLRDADHIVHVALGSQGGASDSRSLRPWHPQCVRVLLE
jgi:hypothetical protein